jgi:hypothetical protein
MAFVSDIHGNLPALEAAVADTEKQQEIPALKR